MSGFIDIHCHILPGIDDGPPDKAETGEMLKIARMDGIAGIVATPHILNGLSDTNRQTIAKAISGIQDMTSGIVIYQGAEIRLDMAFTRRLEKDELPSINDKNFILLELPPYLIPPRRVLEKIMEGLKAKKLTPIFSHPERNWPIVKDLSIMKRLIRLGALFQLTAMSILDCGEIGKSALKMIKKNYVHVIASDAHDSRMRPPVLSPAFDKISKVFGENKARTLFIDNAHKIIKGQKVL